MKDNASKALFALYLVLVAIAFSMALLFPALLLILPLISFCIFSRQAVFSPLLGLLFQLRTVCRLE